MSSFDYSLQPVYDRHYFKKAFPQFDDYVHEIMELYEKGMRYKEFKAMLKKSKAKAPKPALLEIQRFREGYSPFSEKGETCSSGAF